MTRLLWDQIGDRFFETGIDRGVLYLESGAIVAWNGLTSVNEDFEDDVTEPTHLDGIKFLEHPKIGDFSATLTAITYPDEFLECEGVINLDGMLVDGQTPTRFGLTYRTKVGNDLEKEDLSYKIHVLYNLTAVPDTRTYETVTAQTSPMEFSWRILGVPALAPGYKPTAHIIFDLRYLPELMVQDLEDLLYGTVDESPRLPTMADLVYFGAHWQIFWIQDHGDGTWTAHDHGEYITMLDETTFEIDSPSAVYIDAESYTITDIEA
jgi:hypothetical protein